MACIRFLRISAANIGPNRFHQSHNGCADTQIFVGFNKTLRANNSTTRMTEIYQLLLAAEVVEVFEALTPNWNCGFSNGEGLSRVLASDLHPAAEFNSTAAVWLDQNPRPNWIDRTEADDTDPQSIGCSVLFLNWLHHVKNFSWSSIVATNGSTLAKIYLNLTGENDAWVTFSSAMAARWPIGTPSGVQTDQPF